MNTHMSSYVELIGDHELRCLYVALLPRYETGGPDCELWRICTRYLESMLLLRYTRRHGHPRWMRYKDGDERPLD
jgi:hypothetical protein